MTGIAGVGGGPPLISGVAGCGAGRTRLALHALRAGWPRRPGRTLWAGRTCGPGVHGPDIDPLCAVPHPADPIRVHPHVAVLVGRRVLDGGRRTGCRNLAFEVEPFSGQVRQFTDAAPQIEEVPPLGVASAWLEPRVAGPQTHVPSTSRRCCSRSACWAMIVSSCSSVRSEAGRLTVSSICCGLSPLTMSMYALAAAT